MALALLVGAQMSVYSYLLDRIKGHQGITIQPYKTKGKWKVLGIYASGDLFKPGSGGLPAKFWKSKNRQFYRAQSLDFPNQKDYFFSDEVEVVDITDEQFLELCDNSNLIGDIQEYQQNQEERERQQWQEEEREEDEYEEEESEFHRRNAPASRGRATQRARSRR